MDSPIKLIDTHAHVYGNRFDDIDDVLERAASAGVVHTVIPATKPSEFDAIVKTAGAYSDQISFALGIHPHSAAEVTDDEVSAVAKAASEHGAVAIGECGLDYHYDFAPRDRQIAVFRRQLGIARELDLPAVVHSRE